MTVASDLVIPARDREALSEIAGWDGLRTASFSASDFPVDVVRFAGSSSPPVVVSRSRRAETLKALPATLRERAKAAFERAERPPERLGLARDGWLDLSRGPAVMGVVNVTPDSFSDGGLHFDRPRAIERALALYEEGAAIVDVGGESTRPSNYGAAAEIPLEEELSRVVPVVAGIRRATRAPISVDTRKAEVARAALDAGADAVNDVSALRHDPEMPAVVSRARSGLVLMHMKGDDPRRMQEDTSYAHPLADIAEILAAAAGAAVDAGLPPDRIAVDPGLGFGKSPEGNLLLLRHLSAFRSLGFPVAVGASRKGFVRRFSGVAEDSSAAERLPGSLAAVAAAAAAGAAIVRVHDVAETARFLKMARAIGEPRPAAAAAAAR
ncbi:MAG: dihydropteroate synthase [Acidobacteriota bacterium]